MFLDIQGGAGNDTVILEGARGDYHLTDKDGKWTYTGIVGSAADGVMVTIDGSVENVRFRGGDAGGTFNGTDGDDVINGGAGNDTINGGDGDDTLNGWGGADTINGGAGDDTINGGEGDDTINGGEGDDTIHGWGGNDTITTGGGNDNVNGGAGDDTIIVTPNTPNGGDIVIAGGAGNDTVVLPGSANDYAVALPAVIGGETFTIYQGLEGTPAAGVSVRVNGDVENVTFAADAGAAANVGAQNAELQALITEVETAITGLLQNLNTFTGGVADLGGANTNANNNNNQQPATVDQQLNNLLAQLDAVLGQAFNVNGGNADLNNALDQAHICLAKANAYIGK